MKKCIMLTFDVEEWYDTSFLTEYMSPELFKVGRLHRNIRFPLEILQQYSVPATFFVLGRIVKEYPGIIRDIQEANRLHEIASHSFHHEILFDQTRERIRSNVIDSKKILEDISGSLVSGFRAPYFSINDYAVDAIAEAGYDYDSSLHDFKLNPQYGQLDLVMKPTPQPGVFMYRGLYEITIPVKQYFFGRVKVPFGGGGYFRVCPLAVQLHLIRSFLKRSNFFLLYMHPWEFDPEQPYLHNAPLLKRKRHYIGIRKQADKTRRLVQELLKDGYEFRTVADYLREAT
jgi:polysaccharide deacetylase family protein (PEP-CTERM system associated)